MGEWFPWWVDEVLAPMLVLFVLYILVLFVLYIVVFVSVFKLVLWVLN